MNELLTRLGFLWVQTNSFNLQSFFFYLQFLPQKNLN